MFDKNGDGMISADELGRVLFQMGKRPTLRELQSFVRSVDADSKFTKIISLHPLPGVGGGGGISVFLRFILLNIDRTIFSFTLYEMKSMCR